jgi:hypothetical protein
MVNNVLKKIYLFIDDHVKAPTDEDKCSQSNYIVADVALTKSVQKLNNWKETDDKSFKGIA